MVSIKEILMKLILEKSDFKFANTYWENLKFRFLVVKIGEKSFTTQREISEVYHYWDEEKFIAKVDEILIEQMEHILTKVFEQSMENVPDGEIILRND